MSHTGNFFFAARNQPNYAWWRPLGEILAVAVLAVLFTGVLDLSLEAAGVDTSSGAADKYFGYGSVIVEILAVLVAVWLIGRRPVSSVFTGQPGTKPWVPFAAFAVALVVISVIMSLVGVYGYGASWGQVVGNMGTDFPVELVALLFAALAEEMTFRGVFLQAFTAWTRNPLIGALLAAIPFILVHPQAYGSPVGIAHYFADALLFTLLVWVFNGIWVAVAVHLAWNTFGTVQGPRIARVGTGHRRELCRHGSRDCGGDRTLPARIVGAARGVGASATITLVFEVLRIFTRLGLTSFGGPTAHLGYFRDEFVDKRKWLSDDEYADLVALCQFMPGPASSQVGMAIGLKRAGYGGMLAAFLGFTLPSVILMVAFALGVARLGDISDAGWLAGLKAAAVAVVAQAVMGMAKSIVTDRLRAAVALAAFLIVLLVPHPAAQIGAIVAGMLVAVIALSPIDAPPAPSRTSTASRTVGLVALGVFAALLALLPLAGRMGTSWGMFDSFYRSGALVFGGGHVVLPLLEQATVPTGLVDHDTFLAGYGAAQAVPGPLFTFASFLGASAQGVHWLWGAALATVAIFLPAALLVVGIMPFWDRLRASPYAAGALAGANAAVVGILAAALYTPVFTSGIHGPATMAVAAAAFVALKNFKAPAWAVVIGAAAVGQVVL